MTVIGPPCLLIGTASEPTTGDIGTRGPCRLVTAAARRSVPASARIGLHFLAIAQDSVVATTAVVTTSRAARGPVEW